MSDYVIDKEKINRYKQQAIKEENARLEEQQKAVEKRGEKVSGVSVVIDILSMILVAAALFLCISMYKEISNYRKEVSKLQGQYNQAMTSINEDREVIGQLQDTLEEAGFIKKTDDTD